MKTTGSSVPLSIVSFWNISKNSGRPDVSELIQTSAETVTVLQLGPSSRTSEATPLPTIQPDIMDTASAASLIKMEPEILKGHIPAGHIPRPVVIADYVA